MWQQGEHVAVIGQTGSGKTYLVRELLRRMPYVIFLRTKSDPMRFDPREYRHVRSVAQIGSYNRYLLEPEYNKQSLESHRLCEFVYKSGGWCVVFDETFYCVDELGLRRQITKLLTQGRTLGISVVCGMQRPVAVTRFAISEATHVFSFVLEGRDITETLAPATTPRLKLIVPELGQHEYVYFNRRTRIIERGRAQTLDDVLGVQPGYAGVGG